MPIPSPRIESYLNPQRSISEDAYKIHGYSEKFLSNKKTFSEIAENFLNFIKDKKIIIHNAAFDLSFLDYELRLINQKAIKTLKEKLIRKAYLITPNIPEAEILTKIKIRNLEDMIYAANILLKLGAKNVLVKGGHKNTKHIEDVLLSRKEIKIFKNKKIKTKNTHGTGCTLSSAIATFLSCGKPLKKSCELGTKYVNQAIGSNLNYGKGNGPINHLNSILIDKKFR